MGLFNHVNANRATDAMGAPVPNAIRRIYPDGLVNSAPVYMDPDLTSMRASDMKADANGYFELCYLEDGEYRVEIVAPDGALLYQADGIHVGANRHTLELNEYGTTEQLENDSFLSYEKDIGRYRVQPGHKILICSTDIQYKVMPADEGAPELVSAGGVKFCQTGTRYTNLLCFQQAVARGETFSAGTMVFAGGSVYVFDDDGSTTLPGLTGWRRVVAAENDALLTQAKAKTDLLSVSQSVNLDVLPALVAESSTYDSVSNGIAATASGQTFFVATGPGLQVYRNDTGAGTFLGWHGEVLFDDVVSLGASANALPQNLIVRTREEGYAYKVAAPGASDHHVTFGPNKCYILPLNGERHLAAWGVDGTGETDCHEAFEAAVQQSMADGVPLVLTQERILLDGGNLFFQVSEWGSKLRMRSTCGTIVHIRRGNLIFRASGKFGKLRENLTIDVERYATQVKVSGTSQVKRGDLIYFKNEQGKIDENWNYPKFAVRRIQSVIDDTTVELDQPMDMHFYRWEGNRNGRVVTSITQANPGVVTATGLNVVEGDYIRLDYIEGMTELAGNVYRVGPVTGSSFDLHDEEGNLVDTSTFGVYTASSATLFKQGQTEITLYPEAHIDLDNINFLIGVDRVAISNIDVSTGVITTAEAHGLSTGDIINMHGIGGTIELEDNDYEAVRLSDTTFSLRSFEDVAIDTTGMTAYTGGGYVHSSSGEYGSSVSFNYIAGVVRRCSFAGIIPQWLPGTTDIVKVTASDGLDFDLCHFERGRYCPLIQGGSRNTRVKRSTFSKVRHIDMAGWAQDTLVEDCTGSYTSGLIQSHPCIRTTWRRVRDSVINSANSGIDIRGVGEIVEDCKAWSTAGITVGTQEFIPVRSYEDWVASFTRRITGFESINSCVSAGSTQPMIVERCDVPFISAGGTGAIYVDEHTKTSAPQDRSEDTPFMQIVMPGRVDLPKTTSYASERRKAVISDVTRANPAVVTATAHGFETGDVIEISDIVGMTELNGDSYTITVIDADSFSLDGEDSTGYGAYSSGGEAWAEAAIRDITGITQANPGVVTATAHGFSDGDVVWLSGASGMTEVNQSFFIVASATADTFALTDLDGADVDTSGYGAYSSGGKVTRQASFDTIDLTTKPNVGLGRVGLTTTQLYSEKSNSAGKIVEVPCVFRFMKPGALGNEKYHAQITLKAMGRGGYAEARYDVVIDNQNGAGVYNYIEETGNSPSFGGTAVRLKATKVKGVNRVYAEGDTGTSNAKSAAVNARWCLVGVAEVSLPNTLNYVASLDVEMDVRSI